MRPIFELRDQDPNGSRPRPRPMQNSRDRDHKKLVSRPRPVSRSTALAQAKLLDVLSNDIMRKAKKRIFLAMEADILRFAEQQSLNCYDIG